MTTPINKQSAISIGLALALVAGTWVLATKLAGINSVMREQETNFGFELRTISARMTLIESRLDEMMEGRWTKKDAQHWASMLQALNPKMLVPEASTEQYRGVDAGGNSIHGSN